MIISGLVFYIFLYEYLPENPITNMSLPTSVVVIASYAFYNCYNLKSLFIPT
jgi:hypothetical protein